MPHIPVLLEEVLEFSRARVGSRFVDGTAGDAGYIQAIAKLNPEAKILGIDLDQTSLDKHERELVQGNLFRNVTLVHGNYKNIKHIVKSHSLDPVSAVILDLGFSSSQLDDPARGLSFQVSGPLDMRFDPTSSKTAERIVNEYPEQDLVKIFREYGEEKLASKIAHKILETRAHKRIVDTRELYEVIQNSLPKPLIHKTSDFARRIFQALRIEVNDELENLRICLPDILDILEPGGRMLIISFHSLEDRIVKEFMVNAAKGCICPPDFPQCVCGKNPILRILTKKPVVAGPEEIKNNSRAKPAKLRAAEKI